MSLNPFDALDEASASPAEAVSSPFLTAEGEDAGDRPSPAPGESNPFDAFDANDQPEPATSAAAPSAESQSQDRGRLENNHGNELDDDDHDGMGFFSQTLCVIPIVYVYSLPPKTSSRAISAEAMRDKQIWSGMLKIMTRSENSAAIELVQPDGKLYAAAPIVKGQAFTNCVEAASDSSRYFSIIVRNDQGRSAQLGLGFRDRSESFEFRACLMEWEKKRVGVHFSSPPMPSADLSMSKTPVVLNLKFGSSGGAKDSCPPFHDKISLSDSAPLSLAPPPSSGSRRR